MLSKYDSTTPPLTPFYTLGRGYIFTLIGVVATVTLYGIPIPRIGVVYNVMSWVTVVVLIGTLIRPNNVMIRRVSLCFICLSMGARAAWWLVFSRFAYHPHTHLHFGFGSSVLEFFVYSSIAFGAFMSVVQAEAIERTHG